MIYSKFQNEELSLLGFGTMRLPIVAGGGQGDIDQELVNAMTDYAIRHGINYFDTAMPYHASRSEIAIGKALSRYPRESFYLADKYPGHQISSRYCPSETFEEQLKKCGVDYFDFYLLHNVNERSMPTYMDKSLGIVDYFMEQRELGRIKHLGFSCHADAAGLGEFLDYYDGVFEFCQIQLNYLDWSLQGAKEKYELLTERGIPVWVMEPVRGGKLAHFSEENEALLKSLRPEESVAAWGFRFLQGLPNVKMILSGMSTPEQMADNVKTFAERKPLEGKELETVFALADRLKNTVPCTACRYCCAGCPKGLDIPRLISLYNDCCLYPSINMSMKVEALPPEKLPSACIGCGKCARSCPQNIEIPALMKTIAAKFAGLPNWAEICRQREEAAKKEKIKNN